MSFIALGSALVHRIIQSFFPNSRYFGMSTPSTEEDYRNLPLSKLELEGISFEDFGCAEGDYIDELCKKEGVSFRERIAIHKVWSDHPKRAQLTPPSQEVLDAKEMLNSVLRISFQKEAEGRGKTSIGNAVAVSTTLCLTSLHGKVRLGHAIVLHNYFGEMFRGTVVKNVFEPELVDIAVIELTDGQQFTHFTPVSADSVRLLEVVYVAGLKVNIRDDVMAAVYESSVNIIERGENNALFQSSCVGLDSMSGTGVVLKQFGNDNLRVIGVHTASRNHTTSTSPVKRAEDTVDSTLASLIHDHTAYSVICEIGRVPELIAFFGERGLL